MAYNARGDPYRKYFVGCCPTKNVLSDADDSDNCVQDNIQQNIINFYRNKVMLLLDTVLHKIIILFCRTLFNSELLFCRILSCKKLKFLLDTIYPA